MSLTLPLHPTTERIMISASIPLSTSFVGPKSAVAPPPLPACVRFRPISRVSASYSTTAERTTTSRSHSHIATDASSLYETLGIQMGASCLEVKTAYRRLARVLHPDVASNGQKHTSTDEFIKIHAAYATLSDPQKRADYDRTLNRLRRPVSSPFAMYTTSTVATPAASGFSGYTRRTWETDQCW